jgi:hypothetical protein
MPAKQETQDSAKARSSPSGFSPMIDGDSYRMRGHRARLQELADAVAADPNHKP